MPYGGDTVNVGVREEMESHIDLIHKESGEIVHLAHRQSDGIRRSDHSGSLGELSKDQGRYWRHDPFRRGAHLGPISRWGISLHHTPYSIHNKFTLIHTQKRERERFLIKVVFSSKTVRGIRVIISTMF